MQNIHQSVNKKLNKKISGAQSPVNQTQSDLNPNVKIHRQRSKSELETIYDMEKKKDRRKDTQLSPSNSLHNIPRYKKPQQGKTMQEMNKFMIDKDN